MTKYKLPILGMRKVLSKDSMSKDSRNIKKIMKDYRENCMPMNLTTSMRSINFMKDKNYQSLFKSK